MEEPEEKPFTWADIKEFANKLTPEQLTQDVTLILIDDGSVQVKSVSEMGEDTYTFHDLEFSCTKSDFDPDYFDDPRYETLEEALEKEDYSITPANRVYLYNE